MVRRAFWIVLAVLVAGSASAQTIYWKKDHVYVNGKEIATLTPAPSDQTAPAAPSGLSSSSLTSTSVQLSWDGGGSGIVGYKVYRQLSPYAALPVGTVGAGVSTFQDQALRPSTTYTFTIVAFDGAQNHSAASSAVTVTTLADGDITAPTIPSNPRLTYTGPTALRLDWDASTDSGGSGLAGYQVFREGVLISGSSPVTTTTYTDYSLAANTTYSFTVKAIDNAGNLSAASASRLAFRDDFNRPDATGLANAEWSASGSWNLNSNTASVGSTSGWAQEAFTAKSFGTLRASMNNTARPADSNIGISFWAEGSDKYRLWIYNSELWLAYYSASGGTTLATASIAYWGSGVFRLEADSATRNIKIYLNDTLTINYTETNMTRRNSGKAGLNAAVPSYITSLARVDDFIVEER